MKVKGGTIRMSLDLNFWKYKEGVTHNDSKVYETACCDGEIFDGLEALPIDKIIRTISCVFSGWNATGKYNYEKNGVGSFQIFTTPQIIRFDCYGMSGPDMNLLIDIMAGYGCPLYDPQAQERFDSWTDR